MKNKYFFIIIFLLFCLAKNIKADSTYFSPSFYYTYGSYDEGRISKSLAFYNTLQLSETFYMVNHYDNLKINNKDWDYFQQAFLAGVIADCSPYFFKFNYAHYKGDFTYLPFPFEYSDFTNLYSIDFLYYIDYFYFGASYTHLNQIGFKRQASNQITFRIDKILSDDLFISLKPSYTKLSDDRNLFSASFKIHYQIIPEILLKLGGFGGERAYYLDTDLLTIFNQDDIQKYQLFAQTDLSFIAELKFILAYQHTKFNQFEIDYFVAGIKTSLFL